MQQLSPEESALFPRDDAPTQLDDALWRIPLPLPFALRSVNVYLIGDGAGHWTLIDAGLGLQADEAALRAGLQIAGVPMESLSALVITHGHPDHIGLSGMIHAAASLPVYMLAREDERMYEVWGTHGSEALLATARSFAEHGLALDADNADPRVTARRNDAGSASDRWNRFSLPPAGVIQTVEDGETLTLGRWSYQVFWTPGHSDYHLCLLRSDGVFFAGDHILPGITPNIGLYPQSRPDPLADYYRALRRVRDVPARLVAPGHGQPFVELAARADALRDHHLERNATIRALVAESPEGLTANSVAGQLFGERLRSVDDRRFALAETLAHLEHMRLRGALRRERRDAYYHYLLAETGGRASGGEAAEEA